MYDPFSKAWFEFSQPLKKARNYHSVALLLRDGRVLCGGGGLCATDCDLETEFVSGDAASLAMLTVIRIYLTHSHPPPSRSEPPGCGNPHPSLFAERHRWTRYPTGDSERTCVVCTRCYIERNSRYLWVALICAHATGNGNP
jgi:hypothetical protein